MSKKIIDWNPRADSYTKVGEIDLHEKIHEIKYQEENFKSNQSRLIIVDKLLKNHGIELKDKTVMEVGAGNGYLAIHLIQRYSPKVLYILEPSYPAVDKLIRKNFVRNNIDESCYELVLGSFNDIPLKNHFDVIFAMGALHHSGNLQRTLDELYAALCPGGLLIANEPYSMDMTPNAYFLNKRNQTKKVQGIVDFKEGDRDDNFFRHCEYLTAAYHAGFDVRIFYSKENLLRSIKRKLFWSKSRIEAHNLKPKSFTLLLQKPLNPPDSIPHRW